MDGAVWSVGGGLATTAGATVLLVGWRRPRPGTPIALAGTFLVSLGVLGLVVGLLLAEPGTPTVDALKTGGLAAGAVVALYALWLNDRRRRVEEARQLVEGHRAEHDREKSADERFARAVELLGHEADQVRVGAVAVLAGVARARPDDYTQIVLDVLCAYLRRPFDHPRYLIHPGDWDQQRSEEAERELQVRLSAQRVIADLLPEAGATDPPVYSLDLTGAVLEYFRLRERLIGTLVLRYASLFSSTDLSGSVFRRNVWLTGAKVRGGRLEGQLLCRNVTFGGRAWFSRFTADSAVLLTGTRFLGPAKFSDAEFSGGVDLTGCTFAEPPIDPPSAYR